MSCWLLRRDGELVMAGLMKKEKHRGLPMRFTGIMWEVHNGIHMHQTRTAITRLATEPTRMLDELLCAQTMELHGIRMEVFNFERDVDFWTFVQDNNMQNVIVKDRILRD